MANKAVPVAIELPPPAKKKPSVSIIDRRLAAGTIFAAAGVAIPAAEPGKWVFREVNSRISDDHLWSMLHKKQWEYASASDLACEPGAFAFSERDGRLVKGTHGEIVLLKMPADDFRQVQMEKDRANKVSTFGNVKQSILSAASSAPDGDHGASFLERSLQGLGVRDSREAVSLDQ